MAIFFPAWKIKIIIKNNNGSWPYTSRKIIQDNFGGRAQITINMQKRDYTLMILAPCRQGILKISFPQLYISRHFGQFSVGGEGSFRIMRPLFRKTLKRIKPESVKS